MGFRRLNNLKNFQRKKNTILGFLVFIVVSLAILVWFIFAQSTPVSKIGEILTPTIKNSPAIQMSRPSALEYGIAEGGGLVYFNQKDLEQYFESLMSLGVRWVRWGIEWSVVQPDNSTNYDWEKIDRVNAIAKRYGINSLGIITYAPRWATEQSCGIKQRCAPADSKEFGRFAGEVASRYKDSITYWEIWNEPNYISFWGPKPNVKKYADVLKESYLEIKKANSSAIILSGGLASVGDEQGGNISSLTFIDSLYALGANQYFDAIALHPYTYPVSPNYKVAWNRWQEILPIHQLMIDGGDEEKKIWITEFGAPTGGPGRAFTTNQLDNFKYGADFMYEKAQSDIMTEATNFYQKNTDWMGPFFWFSLRDASDKRDTSENFFGLLRSDWSQKPAFSIFKKLVTPTPML